MTPVKHAGRSTPPAADAAAAASVTPAGSPQRRIPVVRLVMAFLMTAALLILLLSQVSVKVIFGTIRHADPILVALAGIAYAVSYFGRAIRWRVLTTSRRLGWATLLGITAVHNFMIRALPSKLGETTYPVMMRARGVPATEAVAGLLVARIYDSAAAITFFLFSLFLARTSVSRGRVLDVAAGLAVLAICALAVLRGSAFVKALIAWADRLAGLSRIPRVLVGHGIRKRLGNVQSHLEEIQSARQTPALLTGTFLMWAPSFLMTYWLLQAFGTPLDFWGVVFASTLSLAATLVPIGTIGNFGTQEAGWTLGVMLLGRDRQMGITSGFSTHLVGFAMAGLFGLIGAWLSAVGLVRNVPNERG